MTRISAADNINENISVPGITARLVVNYDNYSINTFAHVCLRRTEIIAY